MTKTRHTATLFTVTGWSPNPDPTAEPCVPEVVFIPNEHPGPGVGRSIAWARCGRCGVQVAAVDLVREDHLKPAPTVTEAASLAGRWKNSSLPCRDGLHWTDRREGSPRPIDRGAPGR